MKTLEINKIGIKIPQKYEAPVIEIIEIEVEKGFADYGPNSPNDPGGGAGSPPAGSPWSGGAWN